jgi:CRISPR-associated protein Cas8a1/Csx13
LQEAWIKIIPMLQPDKWQFTRDLALLALASYSRAAKETDPVAQ